MNRELTKTVSRTGTDGNDTGDDEAAPRLIVMCERHRLTAPGLRVALGNLDEVTLGRDVQRAVTYHRKVATMTVVDHEISRKHLAVSRRAAGWQVTDLGSKNGIFVNGEPMFGAKLIDGDVIEAGGTWLMFRDAGAAAGTATDRDLATEGATPVVFRTVNSKLEQRVNQLAKVARTRVAVLIRGETGTGKELVAQALHDASGRAGAFVPINCGALPSNLVEAELFGHRRGAFSGATEDRDGLVRRAHGGTLFLDEIAELPEASQVALLRVLQEGEVRPIGASETVKVDVRIIAATHQDIPARIDEGRFREDLYARLAGFETVLPALRDRREDLGTLIAALLPRVTRRPERFTLHRSAARVLFHYPWPRNVRELEQTLRAAVALTDTGELRLEHLSEGIQTYAEQIVAAMSPEDRALRDQLSALLREHDGNVTAVARAMNKAPMQIRRWCHRVQLEFAQFRPKK